MITDKERALIEQAQASADRLVEDLNALFSKASPLLSELTQDQLKVAVDIKTRLDRWAVFSAHTASDEGTAC